MPGPVRKSYGGLPSDFTREDALALGRAMFDALTGKRARPSLTFAQARKVVEQALTPGWHRGTLVTLPDGFENDNFWRVKYGSKEAFEGDNSFFLLDTPVALVDKSTGGLVLVNYLSHADELDAMRPVTG